MVGMMRLESDDRFNEDPPRFPDDGLIDKVRSVIENRVDDIDSEELDATLTAWNTSCSVGRTGIPRNGSLLKILTGLMLIPFP